MRVILNVIAGVCLSIAGAALALIYIANVVVVPQNETPFKKFLENYGLNLLGDSLAGVMALVTLLVVVASLALQMQTAKETVKEMKEQNDVAKAVARANYKFALFDKRMAVFTVFGEDLLGTGLTGSFNTDVYHRLLKASAEAESLFFSDTDISAWTKRMIGAARDIVVIQMRLRELQTRQDNGEFGEIDQTNLGRHRLALETAQNVFRTAYDWRNAKEYFLPYLRLDSDIVFVGDDRNSEKST